AIENALGAGEDTSESTQSQKSFNISVGDGVYQGSAKGFGGDLVIEVTIKSGEITELEIVESKETPFIAEGAFKRLIPAIIEAQGPVDMISGATVTSNAVMEALENAISIKEAR
ncbi:MAG: FMN-binding protein, partial [Bacillota bacterium]|nr:FMN-binding protein [Bacillota bacterium]